MGLDLYPSGGPPRTRGTFDYILSGMTHLSSEPCPFVSDSPFPIGPLGTCCPLRGTVASKELDALQEERLAIHMYEDMMVDEAASFAGELTEAADRLERRYQGKPKPKGAGWNGTYTDNGKRRVWHSHSTFEEAIAAIREAARWYGKVADLGYGVTASY